MPSSDMTGFKVESNVVFQRDRGKGYNHRLLRTQRHLMPDLAGVDSSTRPYMMNKMN